MPNQELAYLFECGRALLDLVVQSTYLGKRTPDTIKICYEYLKIVRDGLRAGECVRLADGERLFIEVVTEMLGVLHNLEISQRLGEIHLHAQVHLN